MIKLKTALLLVTSVILLAGCQTKEEKLEQYMLEVDAPLNEIVIGTEKAVEGMNLYLTDDFNDVDTVTEFLTGLSQINKAIVKIEEIKAPRPYKELHESYLDGTKDIKIFLSGITEAMENDDLEEMDYLTGKLSDGLIKLSETTGDSIDLSEDF